MFCLPELLVNGRNFQHVLIQLWNTQLQKVVFPQVFLHSEDQGDLEVMVHAFVLISLVRRVRDLYCQSVTKTAWLRMILPCWSHVVQN
jgi:hypothetical protein